MLKKSAIVLSSHNSLHSIYISAPPASSTSSYLPRNAAARHKPFAQSQQPQCRAYAMVADGYSRNKHENLPWPEVTSVNAIPTPYQIFNQKKGSPYSKRKFYELVKLYHPDRHNIDDLANTIPFATKIERYRLVVAANDILSDPIKRSAYDCYGAGWNGQPEVMGPRNTSDTAPKWGDYDGRGWGTGRGGPFHNATWEDWEKWYDREEKRDQKPSFLSNGAFVALIVIFATIGGVGQATRVGNFSAEFTEHRDALHNEMSKDLMRRRRESVTCGAREECVDTFLKHRDPFGYGVTDPEEENYRKLLPAPEVCASGDIKARSTDIYDSKKE
jgi:hypothetical protein